MAISKGYQRFQTRLTAFRADVELADLLCTERNAGNDFLDVFSHIENSSHLGLSGRKYSSDRFRSGLLLHMRNTLNVAFVKEVYEEVTEYFRYILYQASVKGVDPEQVVDKLDITLTGAEVLSIRDSCDVVRVVTDRLFRKLEGLKSPISLLQRMSNRLNLNVSQSLMDAALPYLMSRHIFVHADGVPPEDFRVKYPFIKRDDNKRIKVDLAFVQKAYTAVDALIRAYDEAMIENDLLPEGEFS